VKFSKFVRIKGGRRTWEWDRSVGGGPHVYEINLETRLIDEMFASVMGEYVFLK